MRNNQHGFVKNKLCQTKLIYFIDRITCLVGKKEAAGMIQVDLKRTFDNSPRSTQRKHGLGEISIRATLKISNYIFKSLLSF